MDLTGELVRLRGARPGDAERLAELVRDPEVARFAGPPMLFPETVEKWAEILGQRSPDLLRWVLEAPVGGEAVGATSLHRIDFRDRHCWLGIWIGPPSNWSRGYGTEATRLLTRFAFRQLGMEKVYLGVYEGNERGLRAYAKAGYRVEATLPRDHLLEGRLVTTYWLAAYRDDPLYAL